MYCEKCKLYFEGEGRCPDCNNKKTREVKNDDVCFVIEINMILAGLLEEVYKQNNIPYMIKGRLGAALTLTLGSGIETTCFYVPFICLEKAKELADDIFNSEIMEDDEFEFVDDFDDVDDYFEDDEIIDEDDD